MEVNLKHHTPLSIMSQAGRTCWQSQSKGGCYLNPTDNIVSEDRDFLDRIINKNKHGSVSEHVQYNFTIEGISRAALQELARHRHASLSVKSTRYTLKELREEEEFSLLYSQASYLSEQTKRVRKYLVLLGDNEKYFPEGNIKDILNVDNASIMALENLRKSIQEKIPSDISKYSLPESYKTSLMWTINARSLKNFLSLRSSKAALWEMRELSSRIMLALPEEHRFLFTGCDD